MSKSKNDFLIDNMALTTDPSKHDFRQGDLFCSIRSGYGKNVFCFIGVFVSKRQCSNMTTKIIFINPSGLIDNFYAVNGSFPVVSLERISYKEKIELENFGLPILI